jgi:hypothetical protein
MADYDIILKNTKLGTEVNNGIILSLKNAPSATPSITPSVTPSITPSITPTRTVTPSITPSITPTRTKTPTPTPSTSPPASILATLSNNTSTNEWRLAGVAVDNVNLINVDPAFPYDSGVSGTGIVNNAEGTYTIRVYATLSFYSNLHHILVTDSTFAVSCQNLVSGGFYYFDTQVVNATYGIQVSLEDASCA